MLSDSPEQAVEAFELCLSVWNLILSYCPEKEVGEVKRLLGTSLIEQTCDLREEASTLLEIWRQMREDLNTASPRHSNTTTSHCEHRLAEPPEVRQRLIQEIKFFVEYLEQRSAERQHHSNVLINHDKNKEILHYVEATTRQNERGDSSHSSRYGGSDGGSCVSVGSGRWSNGSRPRSALSSQDGRETPLRTSTPGTADGSVLSVLSDTVEAVNEHFNATDIDSVISHLRQAMKEECKQHHRDIDFLQSCLDGDHTAPNTSLCSHGEGLHSEPTIRELRDFGTKLEHAVLEEARLQPPTVGLIESNHKSRLPPLLTDITPRPPPKLSSGHHNIARASQVKRKNSNCKLTTTARNTRMCTKLDCTKRTLKHGSQTCTASSDACKNCSRIRIAEQSTSVYGLETVSTIHKYEENATSTSDSVL